MIRVLGGQLALELALVERGQQLAQGQVAGAAEDREVAGRQVGDELGGGKGHLVNAKARSVSLTSTT